MNIAIALNEKFYRYGYVLLTSIFENHKGSQITIYVLYRDLCEASREGFKELAQGYGQEIVFLFISTDRIPEDVPSSEKWTCETYFRLALPDVLSKEVDRILYLDIDTIVDNPLDELYHVDFEGEDKQECLIAGCPDMSDGNLSEIQREFFGKKCDDPSFHYINAGVVVMNIAGMRAKYTTEFFIKEIRQYKECLEAFDQDLINYEFYGKIKYLDARRYNHFARIFYNEGIGLEETRKDKTLVIHYTGPKPWSITNLRTDIEKIWWEYARKTPFYTEMMEEVLFGMMETGYKNTNEFRIQSYREQQYLDLINDSRALIEKLTQGR